MNWKEKAVEKLRKEAAEGQQGMKQQAIAPSLLETLEGFCEQDEEFAQAVVQSDSTFSEVCNRCVEGTGNSINGIDMYKKAVNLYFPGATIRFNISIELCGGGEESEKKNAVIDITDLL